MEILNASLSHTLQCCRQYFKNSEDECRTGRNTGESKYMWKKGICQDLSIKLNNKQKTVNFP